MIYTKAPNSNATQNGGVPSNNGVIPNVDVTTNNGVIPDGNVTHNNCVIPDSNVMADIKDGPGKVYIWILSLCFFLCMDHFTRP